MVEPGFMKADSRTLPKLNVITVWKFFQSDERFNAPEVKAAKTFKSGREDYGDAAIGYVCLRRDGPNCIVKARVCPEHKVRNKPYTVSITINEEEEEIIDLICHDCPAAEGGCKHAIAVLMWIHRRSSEPSPTEVQCYWKKAVLSSAVTSIKYKTAEQLSEYESTIDESKLDNSTFLEKILKYAEEKQLDSQLSRHGFQLRERQVLKLSLHQLLIDFCETGKSTADEFIDFASSQMSYELCQEAEIKTRDQSNNVLWYELRYGRITASKLYEAAHCKTNDGSFVRTVIGAAKVFDTKAMQRGRTLEEKVIEVAVKQLKTSYRNSGFVIQPRYPILGASPDAKCNDFIIEVKCPSSEKGFNNFLPNGDISMKCKAQINLQMFATGLLKGLFIVASPDFEKTQEITSKWIHYDEDFTMSLMNEGMTFWKKNIFPKLFDSVKK